jgi:YfiH family protein
MSIKFIFTTKQDGNLAFHVGDNKENVINRHIALSLKHNYDKDSLVYMNQIHSNIVYKVTKDDNFTTVPTCDALITNQKNKPLMVMVADCTPLIFYDKTTNTIAVAHAGREGTFTNIVHNVVEKFKNSFGAKTKDIKVKIGASICSDCYEVSYDIYKKAQTLNLEDALYLKNNHYYLDIKKILLKQLQQEGIDLSNINNETNCNSCNTNKYFSYRKEKQTGRFAGIVILS